MPDPTLYDDICARCWRIRAAFEAEAAGSSTRVESASSSGESVASTAPTVILAETA